MKKNPIISFQLLIVFGVLALALPVLTVSISHAEPQTTPSDRNQKNGERNLSEGSRELLDYCYQAENVVVLIPEDIPLEFKAGTNAPVHIGALPDDTGIPSEANNLIIQGFVDQNGQPHNFTSVQLSGIFSKCRANTGNIGVLRINMKPEVQENLLADSQGIFVQAKRIHVIDLIVRDFRTNQKYVVRNVSANSVMRDALNAVLTRTLRRSNKISEEK